MDTHKCSYCSFSFNESEKEWDIATKSKQCPKCRKALQDFPPGRQQGGIKAAPTIAEYLKQSSRLEQQEQTAKPAANYEIALLAIPVLGIMLIYYWVAQMSLLQSPGSSLDLILVATIAGTAIVAAMEASNVGMKGRDSPVNWFFSFLILWVIAYPLYLYKRKNYGLANRLVIGIVIMLIFSGISYKLHSEIESKKAEIRGKLEQLA